MFKDNQKIKSREELAKICEDLRKQGKKIVFANGCFDIIHVGHIRYFRDAKSKGDVLIVGLNSDESVRQLKGEGRPLINENERAEILSEFSSIDYICIFPELKADETILALKPNYHAKGPDYLGASPEDSALKKVGGEFVICGDPKNHSTTDILKEIIEKFGKKKSDT